MLRDGKCIRSCRPSSCQDMFSATFFLLWFTARETPRTWPSNSGSLLHKTWWHIFFFSLPDIWPKVFNFFVLYRVISSPCSHLSIILHSVMLTACNSEQNRMMCSWILKHRLPKCCPFSSKWHVRMVLCRVVRPVSIKRFLTLLWHWGRELM